MKDINLSNNPSKTSAMYFAKGIRKKLSFDFWTGSHSSQEHYANELPVYEKDLWLTAREIIKHKTHNTKRYNNVVKLYLTL